MWGPKVQTNLPLHVCAPSSALNFQIWVKINDALFCFCCQQSCLTSHRLCSLSFQVGVTRPTSPRWGAVRWGPVCDGHVDGCSFLLFSLCKILSSLLPLSVPPKIPPYAPFCPSQYIVNSVLILQASQRIVIILFTHHLSVQLEQDNLAEAMDQSAQCAWSFTQGLTNAH